MHEGLMRDLERFIVLQVVDVRWREHLENMDYMREGIHLRGMAQKDPLVEYRNEGHGMFLELNRAIREEVVALLFHAQVQTGDGGNGDGPTPAPARAPRRTAAAALNYQHESVAGAEAIGATAGGNGIGDAGQRCARAAPPVPVVKSDQRERRPQRPVLVRLRQEVQALPRRVARIRLAMAEADAPLSEQLEGIGTQLLWVRDYL